MAKLVPVTPSRPARELGGHLGNKEIIVANQPVRVIIGGKGYTLAVGRHCIPCIFRSFRMIEIEEADQDQVQIEDGLLPKEQFLEIMNTIADTLMVGRHLVDKWPIIDSLMSSDPDQVVLSNSGMIIEGQPVKVNPWQPHSQTYVGEEMLDYYKGYIYGQKENLYALRADPAITELLFSCDEAGIRLSNPPCIAISYKTADAEPLREALKSKYNINLCDGWQCSKSFFRDKTPEELAKEIKAHQDFIDEYVTAGVLTVTDTYL